MKSALCVPSEVRTGATAYRLTTSLRSASSSKSVRTVKATAARWAVKPGIPPSA